MIKIFFSIFNPIIAFIIASYFWKYINLNLKNHEEVVGHLTLLNYNPQTDTLRFIFLVLFTIFTFFFTRLIQERKFLDLNEFINLNRFEKLRTFNSDKRLLLLIFFIYIFLEYFSSFSFDFFYDALHDGDNLTPAYNFKLTSKFWISSLPIHGLSNIIYGYLGWKIFNLETIGVLRFFYSIIILSVKISVILLSYQITRIFNFSDYHKKIIFIVLSLLLINLIDYEIPLNYSAISYRDLFTVIYLIFFIKFFAENKLNFKFLLIFVLISNISLLLHYDTGTYLNIINFFLLFYLFFLRKIKYFFLLLFLYLIFWILIFLFFGVEELKYFVSHYNHIVTNMDLVHGIEFPQPIFEMGSNPHGSRATKSLVILLISLCFMIEIIFFRKQNIFAVNSKVVLLTIALLGLLMFKNALGRSDSYHIRMASEYPTLLFFIFILYIFFHSNLFEFFKNFIKLNFFYYFIILFLFLNLNFLNILNFKNNIFNFINAPDNRFLDNNTNNFIIDARNIFKNEECIFNFTMDLGLPYLLKKKTCTKYFQTYTNSGFNIEQKYINDLVNINHNYLIYESPNFDIDNIKIKDRLKFVDKFINLNYELFYKKNGFIIYKKN